ncbi:hypothetical protein [Paenibacillus tyrfis]|uniref:Uncharacterized protein n=1 Tax=Paenibacillus tyrfis TaxID=1501230 RepID=A0A081P4C8_9BACL|nr:hypothetical protein [Paenibacillus tyrfis]KEQ25551.1 hypothetical protein ET33_02180 [Paenibacillus tyrfis]
MLLLKGDHIRLKDGRAVEVLDTWGIARCHAKVSFDDGSIALIISERDVAALISRPALERKKWGGGKRVN